jgi:hypothetical protein
MYNITRVTELTGCKIFVYNELQQVANFILQENWSHFIFNNSFRNADNFKSTQFLVYDIDNGVDLLEAITKVKDYKHIVATTKSHMVEKNDIICDRFRIVLVLSAEITDPQIYKNVWSYYFSSLFPEADPSCKDMARLWYKSSTLESISETGNDINISVPQIVAPSLTSTSAAQNKSENNLRKDTLILMAIGAEKGIRNDSLWKAAKDAQNNGFDEDWCLQNLAAKIIAPDFSEDEAKKSIESAFKDEPIPSHNYQNTMKTKILRSKIVRNMVDDRELIVVDEVKNTRNKMTDNAIERIIGGKSYSYMENTGKVITAYFEYNPFKEDLIFTEDDGLTRYNTHTPAPWTSEPIVQVLTLPPIYEEFFNHLINNDAASKQFLLDWLANMLKGRNYTYLTTIGTQGAGKGVLGEIMEKLVGKSNFVKCRDTILKTHFNAPLSEKRLVYIDELDIKKSKEAHDRIKDLANPKLEVEKKGKDAVYVDNYANIYLSSNSWDCIRLESDDRRFSIIELTNTKLTGSTLKGRVDSEILADDNITKLAHYLLQHVILNNMKEPFQNSQRHKEILIAGLKTWENWVIEEWAVENPECRIPLKEIKDRIAKEFQHAGPGGENFEKLAKKFSHILSVSKDSITGEREIVSKVKKEFKPVELNADTSQGINKGFNPEELNLFDKAEKIFDRKY